MRILIRRRGQHATTMSRLALKNMFKLVSLQGPSISKSPTVPKTCAGRPPRGLDPRIGLFRREVFDAVMSQGVECGGRSGRTTTLSRSYATGYLHAPLIAKAGQDMDELQTIIKSLIEGGNRLGRPVLATGNVHYLEPER